MGRDRAPSGSWLVKSTLILIPPSLLWLKSQSGTLALVREGMVGRPGTIAGGAETESKVLGYVTYVDVAVFIKRQLPLLAVRAEQGQHARLFLLG